MKSTTHSFSPPPSDVPADALRVRLRWVRQAAEAALEYRNRGLPADARTELPSNGPVCLRALSRGKRG